MKKIAFILAALLCMTVLLAACGGEAETPTTEALCNHQWAEASCYSPKMCELCGATEGGPWHDYQLAANEGVYPSCLEEGYEQYYCNICDDPHIEKLPATGHTVSDGVCADCGAEVTE